MMYLRRVSPYNPLRLPPIMPAVPYLERSFADNGTSYEVLLLDLHREQ